MVLFSRYKGKLQEFATKFANQKKELEYLTIQKSTVGVVKISESLASVTTRIDQIALFLAIQSPKEKEMSDMIAKHGGPDAVIQVTLCGY
jgi:hypothetical protein